MAPQYAPSLRSRLPLVAFLLTTILPNVSSFYIFLETYTLPIMEMHSFLGSGFSVLLAAMAIQWAVLMNGFLLVQTADKNITIIICSGCHGKTSPVQLLLMALVEVTGFVVNHWILRTLLSVREILLSQIKLCLVSWVLHREGIEPVHEKEKTENILPFSLPHMFLWMFWPSFNSTLVGDHKWERGLKLTVIYGTYLSLAVSVVMALSVSMLTSSKGKMNMVSVDCGIIKALLLSSRTCVVLVQRPRFASTAFSLTLNDFLFFSFIQNHMLFAFECHDTCSVLNVHAVPGILGWFALLFLRLASNESTTTFPEMEYLETPAGLKCFDDQAFWEVKDFVHLHHSKYVVYNDLTPLLNLTVFAFIFYHLKVELMTLNQIKNAFTNMFMIANYVFVSLVVSKFGCTEMKNLWTN
uniref:Rh blood group, D antigen n=1 Tax=Sinocyclocheilus grahami TaxID=75366 RepID=A0A672RQA5_SINGR